MNSLEKTRMMKSKTLSAVEIEKIMSCYETNSTQIESQVKPMNFIMKLVREGNNQTDLKKYTRSLKKTLEMIGEIFQAILALPKGEQIPRLADFFYQRMYNMYGMG